MAVVIRSSVLFSKVSLDRKRPHKYAKRGVTLFSFCSEPEIASGLSDTYALRGKQAELSVKMNTDCDGVWFKDGEQVKPHSHIYMHCI